MVEANASLPYQLSAESRDRLSRCVRVIAMLNARNAVKDRIKAEGKRPAKFAPKEITRLAEEMIAEDPASIARAKASGAVRDELARLYDREARKLLRKLARKSKHLSNSQNALRPNSFH